MIAADRPDRRAARLLVLEADGTTRDLPRAGIKTLFGPGDLVVANDAATLPASLHGTHVPSDEAIEIRLAGWQSFPDPTRFLAIAFGAGD
ncbi:S-adenosylmethionine:tRNA ribosyltransferase-isomerase, partial [Mesorhizobium sp. M0494]